MSYVGEPFRHDILITYSHGDVDGYRANEGIWIQSIRNAIAAKPWD